MVQFLLANPALCSYLLLAKPPRIHAVEETMDKFHAVEETMDKLDNRALCTCWCAQDRRGGKHRSNAHDCANRANAERGSRHVCTSPREKYCSEEVLGGRVRCSWRYAMPRTSDTRCNNDHVYAPILGVGKRSLCDDRASSLRNRNAIRTKTAAAWHRKYDIHKKCCLQSVSSSGST